MATKLDIDDDVRGDTWVFVFNFKDADGFDYDISGFQFWMTFKLNPQDGDADLDGTNGLQISAIANDANAESGILVLRATSSETDNLTPATYFYDLQMKSGSEVTTLLYGKRKVLADITRSTS